jgi:hypothetical protein
MTLNHRELMKMKHLSYFDHFGMDRGMEMKNAAFDLLLNAMLIAANKENAKISQFFYE